MRILLQAVKRRRGPRPLSLYGLVSLLLATCAWVAPASAGKILVPRTNLVIDAPENFKFSQRHRGLAHRDVDAILQVIEVPVPLDEMLVRNSPDSLAKRNMRVVSSEELAIAEENGRLVYVEQEMRGNPYGKWILMFGDNKNSVMVMAHYPLDKSNDFRETLKEAVLSARWNSPAQSDRWEGLSFRISETQTLKLASRLKNGVILTISGNTSEEIKFENPLYVISEAKTHGQRPNLENMAKQRSSKENGKSTLENISGTSSKIAGLDAYELTADIVQNDRLEVRKLYKAVVGDDRMVFVFQGVVGAAKGEIYVPEFRRIAHSMRLVNVTPN